jgi:nucleotide-binding universal stress UspA family protein
VNGTPAGHAAVQVAAAEALLRQRELHVVAAHPPVGGGTAVGNARRAMIDALGWLRATHPDLVVDARVLPGDTAGLVVERSADADLVVVPAVPAATTHDGFPVLGERVAAHAWCPTLVAHHAAVPGGDVAVAVDGSASPDPLLEYGFEAAELRGVPLRAVFVWSALPAAALGTLDPFGYDAAAAHSEADRLLAETLAGWSDKYPDVVVHRRDVRAPDVARALVGVSAEVGLVVVGARSHHTGSGTALGAVAHRLIHRARCPVAAVPLVGSWRR